MWCLPACLSLVLPDDFYKNNKRVFTYFEKLY